MIFNLPKAGERGARAWCEFSASGNTPAGGSNCLLRATGGQWAGLLL